MAAVDDQLSLIIEHMRSRLGHVLAILIATLAHDIPKQDAPLPGIDHIFERRSEQTPQNGPIRRFLRLDRSAFGHFLIPSPDDCCGWLLTSAFFIILPIT